MGGWGNRESLNGGWGNKDSLNGGDGKTQEA